MSSLTIEIKSTETLNTLIDSMNRLAGAFENFTGGVPETVSANELVSPCVTTSEVKAPEPLAPAPPAPISIPTTTVPVAVPVAAPATYGLAELQRACAPLMDAGKTQDISSLLRNSFGVEYLAYLPVEKYGEFATALRGMGAQI